MEKHTDIAVKDLVLIGGGHSHVSVVKMFAMKPLPGLRITLISSQVHTPYSGMLPGFIAGQYDFDEIHLDLRPLAEFAHSRLYHSQVEKIDTQNHLIYTKDRPPIHYDLLSINIGSTPDTLNVPGVKEYAIPIKPVDLFLKHLDNIIEQVNSSSDFNTITVVGGGASGIETILALQKRLEQAFHSSELSNSSAAEKKTLHFNLVSAARQLLPSHNAKVQNYIASVLKQRNINVYLDTTISAIEAESNVRLLHFKKHSDNGLIKSDAVIWCTHASAPQWLKETDLSLDEHGFILVNDHLQSVSHPNIFAAGDIATMQNYERPKSGVFAVRQGLPLFNNLQRFVTGKDLKAYQPQKHFLSLINCADHSAIASRGSFAFKGHWFWRYKDWIDRRFMQKFSHFPDMSATLALDINAQMIDQETLQKLKEIPMRCGGCASKVGESILDRAINRVIKNFKDDDDNKVIIGLQQADDAAVIEVPAGHWLVQSVDYFKAFINDPFVLGKIAANHALGDVYAMGAIPHTALAMVSLPYTIDSIMEEELVQVMSGALRVLNENQMSLVGGHSSEGEQLAFGLTVNGFVQPEHMLTKSGLKAEDKLILTKPLGTGMLLAANMRYKTKGRWIDEAIETMLQSHKHAVSIFKQYNVKACTDITGFGLLGHLYEMLKASKVSARVNLSSLPMLSGIESILQEGIYSSLYEQNIRLKRILSANKQCIEHPKYPLLFDPQTAGGFLIGITQEHENECLDALKEAGFIHAVTIGEVTGGEVTMSIEQVVVELTGDA